MPFDLWPRTDESCVRWESRGAEGRCHGNHFWLSTGYNFGFMIASNMLFDSRGGFSGWSYPMKTWVETLIEVLMDVAMTTIFGFLYMGCTLAPPGKYDWTVVRRRCGLRSNYFDHLLLLERIAVLRSGLLLQTEKRGLCLSVCRSVCLSRSWALQKRLNLSRCRLRYELGSVQVSIY